MKLLAEIRKKSKLDRNYLKEFFGLESRQAYDNIEKRAKYYSITQFLKAYELFKQELKGGAPEFLEKLRKEVR